MLKTVISSVWRSVPPSHSEIWSTPYEKDVLGGTPFTLQLMLKMLSTDNILASVNNACRFVKRFCTCAIF
jgi:hypothetical protein